MSVNEGDNVWLKATVKRVLGENQIVVELADSPSETKLLVGAVYGAGLILEREASE